jgi:hypothetical protein
MPLFLATIMYQVMDTITYRSSWTHRYPEFAKRGNGVMALLEPSQINEPPEIQGRTVTIHKPDGSVSQFIAAGSEAHHSIVDIFFSGISADEILPGSLIEWYARHNNGMHPTPRHAASHVRCVGARVMPGVRRFVLWYKPGN